jgi:hypothetical protein
MHVNEKNRTADVDKFSFWIPNFSGMTSHLVYHIEVVRVAAIMDAFEDIKGSARHLCAPVYV